MHVIKTYSDYKKKHDTVKFLTGVTPCGSICFLSQCWGGCVSDKNLTQQSGFFRKLDRDVVLANYGFTLTEDFAVHGAKLELLAFTRGKTQLTQCEIEKSEQLSMVRIHVERVIGLLKDKFTILNESLPVDVLKHKHDIEVANMRNFLLYVVHLLILKQICCVLSMHYVSLQ